MAKSVTTSMKWHGDRATMAIREELKARLDECGSVLVSAVQDNIDEPGPPHSVPGEYPHQISGELHDSIGYKLDRRSLTLTVGASAEHAPYVEEMRPYLRRTFREMRSKLRAIMLGAGVSRGRFKF